MVCVVGVRFWVLGACGDVVEGIMRLYVFGGRYVRSFDRVSTCGLCVFLGSWGSPELKNVGMRVHSTVRCVING